MVPAALIAKKRDGGELSAGEIREMVDGFVRGSVADYQMSAFAMAIFFRGMTPEETASLTRAMLDSGKALSRNAGGPPRVDKHSTGGLGDKVSLILAPLLACHEVHVPMISGRGLGLSGGTLDKLESIPGFEVYLDDARRERVLQDVGCFIIGADERIAPADRRLYALRDVTGTVESIPLITASILSKKLAASLDALVMDVKVGSGAFMKTPQQAGELARSLIQTGSRAGLPVSALLSDMDQPLGEAVGNAIEVNEAIRCLENDGPPEVNELTIRLAAQVLVSVGRFADPATATEALRKSISDGSACERFERMVAAQGGRLAGPLPLAPSAPCTASRAGYVESIDCEQLGRFVVEIGGGRRRTEDKIDPSVGLSCHVRIGEHVERDQPVLTVHARRDVDRAAEELRSAIRISDCPAERRPVILQAL